MKSSLKEVCNSNSREDEQVKYGNIEIKSEARAKLVDVLKIRNPDMVRRETHCQNTCTTQSLFHWIILFSYFWAQITPVEAGWYDKGQCT